MAIRGSYNVLNLFNAIGLLNLADGISLWLYRKSRYKDLPPWQWNSTATLPHQKSNMLLLHPS